MKTNYLVSIIIPTYNRCKELNKAITSVINQTYYNWEIIIIDNYSTDESSEMVKLFNDKRILFLQLKNYGNIAISRNYGINQSNGEIIAFLDSDDYWYANKLEIALASFELNFDYFFSPMKIQHLNNNNIILKSKSYGMNIKISNLLFKHLLINGNFISTSSVMIRKKALFKYGLFNTDIDLITGEDYELWLRVSQHNNNYFYYQKPLGYLTASNNNTSNSIQSLKFLNVIYQKYKLYLNQNEIVMMKKKWFNFAIIYNKWKCHYKLTFYEIIMSLNHFQSIRQNLILIRILFSK